MRPSTRSRSRTAAAASSPSATTHVIFIDSATNALQGVALSGGVPEMLSSAGYRFGLTVAGDVAYVLSGPSVGMQASGYGLYAIPLAGGDAVPVLDGFSSDATTADATSAYFARLSGDVLVFTPPSTVAATLELGKLMIVALATHVTTCTRPLPTIRRRPVRAA